MKAIPIAGLLLASCYLVEPPQDKGENIILDCKVQPRDSVVADTGLVCIIDPKPPGPMGAR